MAQHHAAYKKGDRSQLQQPAFQLNKRGDPILARGQDFKKWTTIMTLNLVSRHGQAGGVVSDKKIELPVLKPYSISNYPEEMWPSPELYTQWTSLLARRAAIIAAPTTGPSATASSRRRNSAEDEQTIADIELLEAPIKGEVLECIKISNNALVKTHNDQVKSIKDPFPKIYSDILGSLSEESSVLVKNIIGKEIWSPMASDLEKLVEAIYQVHSTSGTGVEPVEKHKIQQKFFELRQFSSEPLSAFYERTRRIIRAYEGLKMTLPTDEEQAIAFVNGLCNTRYAEFRAGMYNNHREGITTCPKTLLDAFQKANNHLVVFRRPQYGGNESLKESAFVGVADDVLRAPPRHNNGNNNKATNRKKPITANNTFQTTSNNKKSTTSKKPDRCPLCHNTDHVYMDQCHLKQKFLNLVKDNKDFKKQNKELVSIHLEEPTPKEDDDDSEDKEDQHQEEEEDYYEPDEMDEESILLTSDEASAFANHEQEAKSFSVILDNGATVNVFKDIELLSDVRSTTNSISITGIGGKVISQTIGTFDPFGLVFYSPLAVANILSLGILESKSFSIEYIPDKGFRVTPPEGGPSISFAKTSKGHHGGALYMASFTPSMSFLATVSENEGGFTKREVSLAKEARELKIKMGYPSDATLSKILLNGGLLSTRCTPQDVARATVIYGKSIGELKGKTVDRKIFNDRVIESTHVIQAEQNLYADLMFVERQTFLITVSAPLGLTTIINTASKEAKEMKLHLQRIFNSYYKRGYSVKTLWTDNDGAFKNTIDDNSQIHHHPVAPGKHVHTVERKIRSVKECARAILSSLPFKLPIVLLPHLITFACHCLNSRPSSIRTDSISPKEAFTGIKLDANKDFRIPFGAYAQVHIPINDNVKNLLNPRTEAGIALGPSGSDGLVKFYIFRSGRVVARSQFQELPIPDDVIDKMNSLRGQITPEQLQFTFGANNQHVGDEIQSEEDLEFHPLLPTTIPVVLETATSTEGALATSEETVIASSSKNNNERNKELQSRRAKVQATYDPSHFSVKQAIKTYGESESIKAVKKEMEQMLNKEVFEPVFRRELSRNANIIYTSLFMKAKHHANGLFDKLKARLVAGGNLQMILEAIDIASPTLDLTSLLIILSISAFKKKKFRSIDITGAFLLARRPTSAPPVYISLSKLVSDVIIDIDPTWSVYRDSTNGTLVCKLIQALYGCRDSPVLWFNTLTSFMKELNFTEHPLDRCVWVHEDKNLIVCIYVDDLLIISENDDAAEWFVNMMKEKFIDITECKGNPISYLGMLLTVNSAEGTIDLSMPKHIEEILRNTSTSKKSNLPHGPNLFCHSEGSIQLDLNEKDGFRSIVASLLYVAKRARPDILLSVQYLSTRVSAPNEDDKKKLLKVLQYLNNTKEETLTLGATEGFKIQAFVDASFGCHQDGKGHTGIFISLGQGPIFVKSSKQKITGRSSTETELIGLSDAIPQILWIQTFLAFFNYDDPAIIFQDNTSTITIIKNGSASGTFTKHINVRFSFIRDYEELKKIMIVHLRTNLMIGDIFTKPLAKLLFDSFKPKVMGKVKLIYIK